jgi:putative ABC transport system permease protein
MDSLYMAGSLLRDLTTNRLRRLLSVLGVIIGTGAVVASLSVVEGGREQIHSYLGKLGMNIVFLEDRYEPPDFNNIHARVLEFAMPLSAGELPPGAPKEGGPGEDVLTSTGSSDLLPVYADSLTRDDIKAIERRFPGAVHVVPQMMYRSEIGLPGEEPFRTGIEGSTPEGGPIRSLRVTEGRYLCATDLGSREKVCVLGATIAARLFSRDPPLGRDVMTLGTRWRVVGVLEPKGDVARFDYDELVILPLTTMQERTGAGLINAVLIQANSPEDALNIRANLLPEVRRRLRNRNEEDFRVFCQEELVQQKEQTLRTFRILSVSIAGFSLLVSGIGIMNIMLVSVRERTREIGIWKAVGATDMDVLAYFLAESVFTCLIGGALGILVGVFLGAQASGLIADNVGKIEGWSPVFRFEFFALAVGAAIVVGLLSGVFPAYTASRLEPVEALRYE